MSLTASTGNDIEICTDINCDHASSAIDNGNFRLKLKYFLHHLGKVSMTWDNCEPTMGTVYSGELEKLLGPARKNEEDLTDYHHALAASAQVLYEEAFFNILKELHGLTGQENLCLAGGCAFNSLANGGILERSPFKKVYIQPANDIDDTNIKRKK